MGWNRVPALGSRGRALHGPQFLGWPGRSRWAVGGAWQLFHQGASASSIRLLPVVPCPDRRLRGIPDPSPPAIPQEPEPGHDVSLRKPFILWGRGSRFVAAGQQDGQVDVVRSRGLPLPSFQLPAGSLFAACQRSSKSTPLAGFLLLKPGLMRDSPGHRLLTPGPGMPL